MSSFPFLLLLFVQTTFILTKPVPFKPCGGSDLGQVTLLEVFPDVIRPGTDFVVKTTFNNTWTTPIIGGVSVTSVYYLDVLIGIYRSDVCEINENGKFSSKS